MSCNSIRRNRVMNVLFNPNKERATKMDNNKN